MTTATEAMIRDESDRLAVSEGCYFDPAEGDRPIRFIESFCRHSKGEFAGKPFELLDWQKDFVRRLYGWRRPDGTRRFRTFYVEVPKKNGKSTLLSGLTLYALVADREPGAEVYVCAYDRSQASLIFDEAARMVGASPELSRVLSIVPSDKHMVHGASHSKMVAVSADVPSKDGVNASFVIFDELHRQKSPSMWDIFKYAGAARRQPLLGAITTAGVDRQSICYRQREYSQKVASGILQDTSHLGIIYAADPGDDIEDPATWAKANPSLGVTLRAEDFAREVREALDSPASLNNFLRLRLNIWTQAASRFLARDKWDACGRTPVEPINLFGRRCYGGLDLSTTTDLSALVLIFPDDDFNFDVLCRFYCPEEGAERREEKDRVPYLTWGRQGFIKLTPGNVIDYAYIEEDLLKFQKQYDLRKVYADPYNATHLCVRLQEQGLPVEFLRQGFLSLSAPTKELERLVLCGKVRHGGHPVLSWCADNTVAEQDSAGNLKPSKAKSNERIDGVAALVNAVAASMSPESGLSGRSVYEKRGVIVL